MRHPRGSWDMSSTVGFKHIAGIRPDKEQTSHQHSSVIWINNSNPETMAFTIKKQVLNFAVFLLTELLCTPEPTAQSLILLQLLDGMNLIPLFNGVYTGSNLSNGGEQIAVKQPLGVVLFDFTYKVAPWPLQPDGQGPSLEVINPLGNPNDPTNWRALTVSGETPGRASDRTTLAPVQAPAHSPTKAPTTSTPAPLHPPTKAFTPDTAAPVSPSGSNYNSWTPTVGNHTVTATSYSDTSGSGTVLSSVTVRFTVVSTTGPTPTVSRVQKSRPTAAPVRLPTAAPVTPPSPTTFTLISANTDLEIGPLTNGMTVRLGSVGTALNIRANVQVYGVKSVIFFYDGVKFRTEGSAPFAFA
jgi:hypothetical protein